MKQSENKKGEYPIPGKIEAGLIFRLAWADLRHEKIVSLCLVLALSAVSAPLLLVMGLKFGTIATFRYRLVEDPANREIRPLNTKPLEKGWFQRMAVSPLVGFLVPCTRQIAGSVVLRSSGGRKADVDMVPTAAGDRLLLENNAAIPTEGEVVLSALAADHLRVRPGETISVQVSRSNQGQTEFVEVPVKVAGVLGFRASGLAAAYAPLKFLESVEAYKDGFAVPEFGAKGDGTGAEPAFNGMVILAGKPLSAETQARLAAEATGCSSVRVVAPGEMKAMLGFVADSGQTVYLLSAGRDLIGENALGSVLNLIRGSDALLLPWIRPLALRARIGNGAPIELSVAGCAISQVEAALRGVQPVPPWDGPLSNSLQISMAGVPQDSAVELLVASGKRELSIPLKAATPVDEARGTSTIALVPSRLAGLLCAASNRAMRFDRQAGVFVNERAGYASFRMYARTIDDVESLRKILKEEGIDVYTEAQRIAQVTTLDRQLGRVFWMIAVVGIAGGLAAMVASLYGTVERKRYEFGVLRLIGISRSRLMTFPLWQSLGIAGGSYLAALLAFHGMAFAINTLFAGELQGGETLCHLPMHYQLAGAGLALILAGVGAGAAAVKINQTTPADALRSE